MATLIEVLETQLNVDVDTMDPNTAKSLPFKPHDMTSNQFIVLEQMQLKDNRELLLQATKEYGERGWAAVVDRISAQLCAANIDNIQGRVLLQTSAFHAYDTQKVIDHAQRYAVELEKVGISKERFCIKIPVTGPAINAAPILANEGIRTLGTSLFSVAQAIAASQAGCLYISPYYNGMFMTLRSTCYLQTTEEINAHTDPQLWPSSNDPALLHTSSARMMQIRAIYQQLATETSKEQPMIKAASFISAEEAMAFGEMQVHSATLPASVLRVLSQTPATPSPSARIPGVLKVASIPSYFDERPLPERLAAVSKTDPLTPGWDGILASTNIDYLANGGQALEKAIEGDQITKQRLADALEFFKNVEMNMKKLVEEAMAEVGMSAQTVCFVIGWNLKNAVQNRLDSHPQPINSSVSKSQAIPTYSSTRSMSSVPRLLVAGLGNLPFPNTRHSLGQLVIDQLAWRTGIRMAAERDGFSGEATVYLGGTLLSLTLYKSKHLMNISGPSIAAACRKRNIRPDLLVVISDSTEHDQCKVKYRLGGSANGHNGLKSIISAIGTNQFHRLRLGVGKASSVEMSDYVLGKLSSHEKQFWTGDGVDIVVDAIEKVALNAKE
ncbi:hypothetical protein MIND_00094000 [Mycena indigotica]|uniref:Uncharacterized protein n=1 Tax=Mycena indigotica TaxID=2126181 RepID=A0A8H6TE36_9AGAR|nr:uncharacterized protein MIND_00094000 [Mycena indigotica]KAF7315780.1 hypothetical protein MIND_00094000 [Mycena indigotica]